MLLELLIIPHPLYKGIYKGTTRITTDRSITIVIDPFVRAFPRSAVRFSDDRIQGLLAELSSECADGQQQLQ